MLQTVRIYLLPKEVRTETGVDLSEASAGAVLSDAYYNAVKSGFIGGPAQFVSSVRDSDTHGILTLERWFHRELIDFSQFVDYFRDYTLAYYGKSFPGNASRPTVKLDRLAELVREGLRFGQGSAFPKLSPAPFG